MKLPKIGKPKKLIKLLRSFKPSGIEAMIACGLVFATAVMIAILPKNGKTAGRMIFPQAARPRERRTAAICL